MKHDSPFLLAGIVIAALICGAISGGLATPQEGGPYPFHSYFPEIGHGSLPAYPYPEPTLAPTPVPFEILRIWTMDGGFAPQAAFHPGDAIYLVVDYFSDQPRDAVFNWRMSPQGCGTIVEIRQAMALPGGIASASRKTTIPTNACAGKYVIRLRATAGGLTVEKQVEIQITAR